MLPFRQQFEKASSGQKVNYMKIIHHFDVAILTENDKIFFLWLAGEDEDIQKQVLSMTKKATDGERKFVLWLKRQTKEKRNYLLDKIYNLNG